MLKQALLLAPAEATGLSLEVFLFVTHALLYVISSRTLAEAQRMLDIV